jgi:hypothetical protein
MKCQTELGDIPELRDERYQRGFTPDKNKGKRKEPKEYNGIDRDHIIYMLHEVYEVCIGDLKHIFNRTGSRLAEILNNQGVSYDDIRWEVT